MSSIKLLSAVILSICFAFCPKMAFAGCDAHLGEAGVIEREADFIKQLAPIAQEDEAFVKKMNEEPVKTYFEVRQEVEEYIAKHPGKDDFPFKPHEAVLKRIIADLKQRLHRKFGDKYEKELRAAMARAIELLAHEAPYKATSRFIMYEYLPTLNLILHERHPHLKGTKNEHFHRNNAERSLEPLLNEAPDHFVYFSFAPVDEEFFINSRTAPMNMIGIGLDGLDDVSDAPYGDRFYMSNGEFSWHDVGHAEFTAGRDLKYLRNSGKDIYRVLWEWEYTRRRIKAVVDQIRSKDEELGRSVNRLLFELLRERGFQFSLTVLKQELDTPKWTKVLQRKFKQGFYEHYSVNPREFERLEEARILVLKAVERLREEDQIQWLDTLRAHIVPTRVIHTPALEFAEGRLQRVELRAEGQFIIETKDAKGKSYKTEIREMISAQVSPTEKSPFTKERIAKVEQILSMKDSGYKVYVDKNKNIYTVSKQGLRIPIDQVVLDPKISITRKLDNIEIFEVNQTLGAEERGEEIAFTVRKPERAWKGFVTVEKNLVTGTHMATVRPIGGQEIVVPLVEIKIDPL